MSASVAQLPNTVQFALPGGFRRCGSIPELSACSGTDTYADRQPSGLFAEPDPAPAGFWGLLARGRRRPITSDAQPASAADLYPALPRPSVKRDVSTFD